MPHDFLSNPLFGVATTLIAYALGRALQRRFPPVHVVLTSCALLIAMITLARVPYDAYKVGGDYVAFLLGPATVALAVPLYKNAHHIRPHLIAILTAIFAGALMGIVSVFVLGAISHGSDILLRSMLAKSATTPISIELTRSIAGSETLAAVTTALAGLIGAIVGLPVLRLLGVTNPLAEAAAIGTSAHGLGTARLVHESPLHAGVSALAMATCGIFTSLLFIPLRQLLA